MMNTTKEGAIRGPPPPLPATESLVSCQVTKPVWGATSLDHKAQEFQHSNGRSLPVLSELMRLSQQLHTINFSTKLIKESLDNSIPEHPNESNFRFIMHNWLFHLTSK